MSNEELALVVATLAQAIDDTINAYMGVMATDTATAEGRARRARLSDRIESSTEMVHAIAENMRRAVEEGDAP